MVHSLRLNKAPFEAIKARTKTIEMRLYDEKRQKIKVGDEIIFSLRDDSSQTLHCKVKSISVFDSFKELYNNYDKVCLGYLSSEPASSEDMEQYYSKDEQALYGVVAIEVEVV